MLFEIYHFVVLHAEAFTFEQFLHKVLMSEMVFPGEQAVPVDHPVSRQAGFRVRGVHSPTNHAGSLWRSDIAGNGPVRSYPAGGYPAHHGIHPLKKSCLQVTLQAVR